MIQKYIYGIPFTTDATIQPFEPSSSPLPYFSLDRTSSTTLTYSLCDEDIVYGLGESNRGINKRGYLYTSNCTDEPSHTEEKLSLYGAHNFIMIDGTELFGLFIDCPQKISFDIGYTNYNILEITTEATDYAIYIINGTTKKEIISSFRRLIGESYIAPKWAFGYGQSRWGYKTESDFYKIVELYEKFDIPLDSIYMDIDYMDNFKDFTINTDSFPNFNTLVSSLKDKGIKLVPIIDAGIKIEDNYSIYEEGKEKGFFCLDDQGNPFVAAVWPGKVHFPDVLNKDARLWFGKQYNFLIEKGIEGFWNDMNEPSIFYSERGLQDAFTKIDSLKGKNLGVHDFFQLKDTVNLLSNNEQDYKDFYHNVNGKKVLHNDVHNLYGYYMTRAAAEGFDLINPNKRFLLFSRASSIGMHRYGGIWTGDNCSWWSHLLLNIKMMPSLNMCGFLYAGADLGGFGCHTTYDLMVRWLQFGIFTPLMRNHSALGTREQELYQFQDISYFSELIKFRYRLIPYLYCEYMKAVKLQSLIFTPLSFEYEKDEMARTVEDQLLFGESLMIAPVYTQNANGRYVYLPEKMLCITFSIGNERSYKIYNKGHHYISLKLEEFCIFIRKNTLLPLCLPSSTTECLNDNNLELIGFTNTTKVNYFYYQDDGYSKNVDLKNGTLIEVSKENNSWSAYSSNKNITFFDLTIIEE